MVPGDRPIAGETSCEMCPRQVDVQPHLHRPGARRRVTAGNAEELQSARGVADDQGRQAGGPADGPDHDSGRAPEGEFAPVRAQRLGQAPRDPGQIEIVPGTGPGGVELVSACTTDVSGDDYDEALTIATGFLVAEASTVVGSLWPVPDRRTATLMFMFHHYLNRMELAPAAALRAAQLWMLDPDRTAPRDMPQELARHVREPGLEDLYAWAAFAHRGR
jgi:hypothetical protein